MKPNAPDQKSVFLMLSKADMLSILSLSLGVIAIFFSFESLPHYSAVAMLVAAFLDYADGKVARRFGSSSLGTSLDTIADIVSFGVAPAAFLYSLYPGVYAGAAYLTLVIAGALRLSRFSVLPQRKYFSGVPITMNGIVFPLIFYAGLPPYSLPFFALTMSLLMVSRKRIPKLR